MAITRAAIQGALEAERSFVQKGGRVEVASADWDDGYLVLGVRSVKGQRRVVVDEALEGVRAKWGDELEAGGIIKLVDSDNDRIVIQVAAGGMPAIGSQIWLFPGDFLGPLIDMWAGEMGALAAKRLRQTKEETEPLQPILPLGDRFSDLRQRQVEAVQNSAYRCSITIGPPGTGKRLHVKLRLEGWSQRSCVRCVFHMHLGNGRRKVFSGNTAWRWKDADASFPVQRLKSTITT